MYADKGGWTCPGPVHWRQARDELAEELVGKLSLKGKLVMVESSAGWCQEALHHLNGYAG